MKRVLALGIALGLTVSAGADEPKADVAAGQAASAMCIGCHGVDGNSMVPMFPSLAGQPAEYLVKQLQGYKDQSRKGGQAATMYGMVASLDETAMRNIAAFYAAQTPKPGTPGDKELTELGAKIYANGVAERNVATCVSCHGQKGEGFAPMFPRLAGQKGQYLVDQLKVFKSGVRDNDAAQMMRQAAAGLSEQEIQALAAYLSSL